MSSLHLRKAFTAGNLPIPCLIAFPFLWQKPHNWARENTISPTFNFGALFTLNFNKCKRALMWKVGAFHIKISLPTAFNYFLRLLCVPFFTFSTIKWALFLGLHGLYCLYDIYVFLLTCPLSIEQTGWTANLSYPLDSLAINSTLIPIWHAYCKPIISVIYINYK